MILPFVPGDSIFEAFRLASRAGIEVALVDTDVSVAGEQRPERTLAVGPEFASRPGDGFFAAVAALSNREAPLVSDLAREAAMAAALAALMAQHESVLVGGWLRALVADHRAAAIQRFHCAQNSTPAPRRRFVARPSRIVRPVAFNGPLPGDRRGVRAERLKQFEPFDAMRTLLHEAASSRARCMTWHRPSPQRPSTWLEPACMRETSRRPPASASSRSWPNWSWRRAPPWGPAMRRGSSHLRRPSHLSAPGAVLDPLTFEVDPRTRAFGEGRGWLLLPRQASLGGAVVCRALAHSRATRRCAADTCGARCRIRDAAGRALQERRSTGARIRRIRRPTKDSSGMHCAAPVSSTRPMAHRCRS